MITPNAHPLGSIAMGFRAESESYNWAAVSRTDGKLLLVASGTQDRSQVYDESQGLAFFRKRLHQMIDQYAPAIGGVRYPEHSARKPKHPLGANARVRIEGVILESLASKGVQAIAGDLNTISSEMGSSSAKAYITGSDVRGINLKGVPKERREAIIVAVAALESLEAGRKQYANQE